MAGESFHSLCVLSMIVCVCLIAYVDIRSLRIPDGFNIALAVGGAVYQFEMSGLFPAIHLITAGVLFLSLLLIRNLFFHFRGSVGLGLGDVKMAAAAIFWIDPLHIPQFLMIASALGIAVIIAVNMKGRGDIRSFRMPFGPFLGIALLAVWAGEAAKVDFFHAATGSEFIQ